VLSGNECRLLTAARTDQESEISTPVSTFEASEMCLGPGMLAPCGRTIGNRETGNGCATVPAASALSRQPLLSPRTVLAAR
jgi:hypothetical protein